MKRLFSLLLLAGALTTPTVLVAQNADHQKALLWWLTTQRIWRDNGLPKDQQPLPDSAGLKLDDVQKRLQASHGKGDIGGAYKMYCDVENKLPGKKMRLAEPAKIADQIEAQLREKRKNKPDRLRSVDTLRIQFAAVLTPAKTSEVNSAKQTDSSAAIAPPVPPLGGSRSSAAPTQTESTDAMKTSTSGAEPGFAHQPRIALAVAGLLGMLFGGAAVGWWMLQRTRSSAMSDDVRIERKYWSEMLDFKADLNRLEGDNFRLKAQLEEYLKAEQRASAKSDRLPTKNVSPPAPQAAAEAASQPAEISIGDTVDPDVSPAPPPAAPQLTTHYAPALETGFLEDRQLQSAPLDHLPIELTIDPRTPNQARFRLNASVDQRYIIEAGINRLTEFFAFERPIQKPSSLRPGSVGKLRREEGGWRVEDKAGLELS